MRRIASCLESKIDNYVISGAKDLIPYIHTYICVCVFMHIWRVYIFLVIKDYKFNNMIISFTREIVVFIFKNNNLFSEIT